MMRIIVNCCAGIDVHKKVLVVCVLLLDADGAILKQFRKFGTTTREILGMADWLIEVGVTQVAMESTGVYWKPVINLLEGHFERVILVNPEQIKKVPGRKTDVKDSEWIAELVQYGLLAASFVPDRPMRELRDLTRHRVQLVQEKTRESNRVQKILESANIRLGSVASDILGVSGRRMIDKLVDGETDPEKLAELARGRLRGKIPELKPAMEGSLAENERFLLGLHMKLIRFLEAQIESLERAVEQQMEAMDERPEPQTSNSPCGSESQSEAGSDSMRQALSWSAAMELLQTHPGIMKDSAHAILAEIGTDMSRFASDKHLAAWAGMCPGNNQSAGKRKGGRRRKGDVWLQRILTQVAWAASRTKNTYYRAQYHRLAGRRGKKRAIVAVGHSILIAIYHMLRDNKPYQELGPDYFDKRDPDKAIRYHVRRLEQLGQQVTLAPAA